MAENILLTLAEYLTLPPFNQGYAIYMQAEHPGSELKMNQVNPYPTGSAESDQWYRGNSLAALEAQDGEE